MMIETNMIWFPNRGVKLTPNPSKRDLCRITQEHRVPQKAQGLGLYQPKSSNLIYKRKSGNVFLPGKDICISEEGYFISLSLWEVYSSYPYLNLRVKVRNEGKKREERREMWEAAGTDLNNLHYWHPLALKPSRLPPSLVLFYTTMILFLGGEGITFISTPYSLWLLSFRLQARGLLWVSIPTSHLKRGVRHWGLTPLEKRGRSFSKVAPFLTRLA